MRLKCQVIKKSLDYNSMLRPGACKSNTSPVHNELPEILHCRRIINLYYLNMTPAGKDFYD
jgi:hypothetical protein